MFKKIWNDPVWSKVISAGIIGLLGFLGALVYSKIEKISILETLKLFWEYSIQFGYVLCGILLFVISSMIYKNVKQNSKTKQVTNTASAKNQLELNKAELRKINKHHDEESGLLYKWRVWFDRGQPKITDIEVYCTKHINPLKLDRIGCIMEDCDNQNITIDINRAKLITESILIHAWDELNEENE